MRGVFATNNNLELLNSNSVNHRNRKSVSERARKDGGYLARQRYTLCMKIRVMMGLLLCWLSVAQAEVLTPGDLREDRAPGLEQLFLDLRSDEREVWRLAEDALINRFNQSGSPAMDLLLQRGHHLIEDGKYADAVWHLSALIDHAPSFAEAYNARATAYYLMGELGLSLADIRITLYLNPRHFGAMSGLGIVLEELGHPDQALSAYRAAAIVHPNFINVQDSIARLQAARTTDL